ncbi:MAG: RNase adapter RapZ [Deltaproteobacteria bacterium]|nr:RNase adapter RapZ [Deltaproteobacteria bacterium]
MSESNAKPVNAAGTPLVIITGLSGAGKSTAMRCLEDLGRYCVDNLPPALVPTFYSLYRQSYPAGPGVAIASDVRSGSLFDDFTTMVDALRGFGVAFEILYLDCDTDALINRFMEVRRSHPLQEGRSIEEAIEEERRRLEPNRAVATRIIDTGSLTAGTLREALVRILVGETTSAVRLEFTSFGFKYGIPLDADFVFDVRFLPNPFYVPGLERLSGEDDEVYRFVMDGPLAEAYFGHIVDMLRLALPEFVKVGKFAANVAVGCTGGRHRSVAFARRLAETFRTAGQSVVAVHRDLRRPEG